MKPVSQITSPALLLLNENIDTDQIIPARFLRKPRNSGYHHYLLYDARYDMDGNERVDSPIPASMPPCSIVLAGHNIGCGSSREGAVYAFVDYGIQVIISTKIADIFRNNAMRNGLLPIQLEQEAFYTLVVHCQSNTQAQLSVDLERCEIRWEENNCLTFDIDEGSRERLLHGIDDIQATLAWEQDIVAFQHRYLAECPWILPNAAVSYGK
ncbi:3-isopropylmalate dehydratase small subunit [Halomonas cupida]|uniref:3-isopropylmalate dehydratase n=1 Tax=Halomonas cupida TaxID=44933 RepID=A0A1M7CR59_9GAMM|nr:3-isopropylmalate dehydratase small subunit [Halomonas cupida]GEN26068.1 3-isopropylmalate dehydratase small subunit [Halomonas cupida]SHL69660.1 3-isopropylmalate/(R)-2-methylmalate dehydratase small subunit [Halomonas cupida]